MSEFVPTPLRSTLRRILHIYPQHTRQSVESCENISLGRFPVLPRDSEELDILQLADTAKAQEERVGRSEAVGVMIEPGRRRDSDGNEDILSILRCGHRELRVVESEEYKIGRRGDGGKLESWSVEC